MSKWYAKLCRILRTAPQYYPVLEDNHIPLRLSTTVVEIHGKDRLEGVTIAAFDENKKPIDATREYVPCDTLLLSVGLIPENELSKTLCIAMDPVTGGPVVSECRETSVSGVFACGNVLHVHDIVDFVSTESTIAGRAAARRKATRVGSHSGGLSGAVYGATALQPFGAVYDLLALGLSTRKRDRSFKNKWPDGAETEVFAGGAGANAGAFYYRKAFGDAAGL